MEYCRGCINYGKCKIAYDELTLGNTFLCKYYKENHEVSKEIEKYVTKFIKYSELLINKQQQREKWIFERKICEEDYYYRARKEYLEMQNLLNEDDIELEGIWNI